MRSFILLASLICFAINSSASVEEVDDMPSNTAAVLMDDQDKGIEMDTPYSINSILPAETLSLIFSNLDNDSAMKSRLVCRQWNFLLTDPVFIGNNENLEHVPWLKMYKITRRFVVEYKSSGPKLREANWEQRNQILSQLIQLDENFRSAILNCPWRSLRGMAYFQLYTITFSWDNFRIAYSYALDRGNDFADIVESQTKELFQNPDFARHMTDENVDDKMLKIMQEEIIRNMQNHGEYYHPLEKAQAKTIKLQKAKRKCCEIHHKIKKVMDVARYGLLVVILAKAYYLYF